MKANPIRDKNATGHECQPCGIPQRGTKSLTHAESPTGADRCNPRVNVECDSQAQYKAVEIESRSDFLRMRHEGFANVSNDDRYKKTFDDVEERDSEGDDHVVEMILKRGAEDTQSHLVESAN